ncbi:MAG: phosphoglycolate phosphatase [Arenicellales bacterium]
MTTSPLKIRGILFDLDGTLVDSAPDIGNAANSMLKTLGIAPAENEQIQHWIGNGIPKLVKRALTKDFDGEPDAALFDEALPIFMGHYERDVCVDSYMYNGVAETLKALHDQGYILGVVTNKNASCTLPLLNQLGIDEYFTSIVSGDTCANKKPHPEPILFGLKEMELAVDECVLVGDSAHDIHAAHAANLKAIAVNYGYSQGVDLSTQNAHTVVEQFADILPYFELRA